MQSAVSAARHHADRSLTILVIFLALIFITSFAGLTAPVRGATGSSRHAGSRQAAAVPAPKKAVIVAGPVGSDTKRYIAKAEAIARAAEDHGMTVVRLYTPHATWSRVVDAANGADLFVYIGHGNGWPSPHGPFQEDSKDGVGLNPYDGSGNTTTKYYGANKIIESIHFAPNAIVLLNHLCYSAGQGEEGTAIPTQAVAVQRVDNFASGFLAAGAGVVFALRIQPGENLVDTLFTKHTTMDGFFMSTFGGNSDGTYAPYYGWVGEKPNLYFDSVRTPGARIHMDPDHAVTGNYPGYSSKFGWYRGATGDLGLTTDEWLDGTGSPDNDPPVVSHLLAGQATNTIPAGENALPVFTPNGDGLSDTLTVSYDLSEPADLEVSIAKQDGSVVKKSSTWSERGASTTTWNGRNGGGEVVADGKYDITVTPRDRAGNVGEAAVVSVKVLTAMKAPRVSPMFFYPADGDALAQVSTQSVTLTKPATLRWRILNAAGDGVRLGPDDQAFPAGAVSWAWDGLDNAGDPVPDGLYSSVVSATTDDGTYSHKLVVRVGAFNLKGTLNVKAGQKVRYILTSSEPMKAWPTIQIKQPGVAAYTLRLTKYSSTKFVATWNVDHGAAGAVEIKVTGTDTGGGVQTKVFNAKLQ